MPGEQQYAKCSKCGGFVPVSETLVQLGWKPGTAVDHPPGGCAGASAGSEAKEIRLDICVYEVVAADEEDEDPDVELVARASATVHAATFAAAAPLLAERVGEQWDKVLQLLPVADQQDEEAKSS